MDPLALFKLIGTPGSTGFLVACAVVGLVLLRVWPRRRRLVAVSLLAVVGGYLVLSVPWVAEAIANRLPAYRPSSLPAALDAIVVLDGDNRRGRVKTTVELYEHRRQPAIWVLGDKWIADALIDAHVPAGRIQQNGSAHTTREQVAQVQALQTRYHIDRLVIVASRLQIPRLAAVARAARLDAELVPSPIDDEPPTTGPWRFVPAYIALRVSRDALYEHMAIGYYRWRGWILPLTGD